MTEAKLHRSVAKTLNKTLNNNVFWTSVEVSTGINNCKRQKALKNKGVKTGFPDIIVMWNDDKLKGLCIELKWGNNKPTDIQTKVHNELANKLEIPTVICRSIDEVLHALNVYDVPTKISKK